MDLLNYQYLDKMNNNIGILCYEGKKQTLTFSLLVNEIKYLSVKITDAGDVIASRYTFTSIPRSRCFSSISRGFRETCLPSNVDVFIRKILSFKVLYEEVLS